MFLNDLLPNASPRSTQSKRQASKQPKKPQTEAQLAAARAARERAPFWAGKEREIKPIFEAACKASPEFATLYQPFLKKNNMKSQRKAMLMLLALAARSGDIEPSGFQDPDSNNTSLTGWDSFKVKKPSFRVDVNKFFTCAGTDSISEEAAKKRDESIKKFFHSHAMLQPADWQKGWVGAEPFVFIGEMKTSSAASGPATFNEPTVPSRAMSGRATADGNVEDGSEATMSSRCQLDAELADIAALQPSRCTNHVLIESLVSEPTALFSLDASAAVHHSDAGQASESDCFKAEFKVLQPHRASGASVNLQVAFEGPQAEPAVFPLPESPAADAVPDLVSQDAWAAQRDHAAAATLVEACLADLTAQGVAAAAAAIVTGAAGLTVTAVAGRAAAGTVTAAANPSRCVPAAADATAAGMITTATVAPIRAGEPVPARPRQPPAPRPRPASVVKTAATRTRTAKHRDCRTGTGRRGARPGPGCAGAATPAVRLPVSSESDSKSRSEPKAARLNLTGKMLDMDKASLRAAGAAAASAQDRDPGSLLDSETPSESEAPAAPPAVGAIHWQVTVGTIDSDDCHSPAPARAEWNSQSEWPASGLEPVEVGNVPGFMHWREHDSDEVVTAWWPRAAVALSPPRLGRCWGCASSSSSSSSAAAAAAAAGAVQGRRREEEVWGEGGVAAEKKRAKVGA